MALTTMAMRLPRGAPRRVLVGATATFLVVVTLLTVWRGGSAPLPPPPQAAELLIADDDVADLNVAAQDGLKLPPDTVMVVPGAAPGTTAAVIDLTGEEPRVVRMMVGSEGLLVPPPPSVDPYPRGWLPAAFVADRIPRLPTLPQRSGQLHLGAAENTPLSPLSGYMASAVETGGLRSVSYTHLTLPTKA